MRRRLLMIVPGVLIVALVVTFLALGISPPKPQVQSVDHVVQIDRLAPPPATPSLPPVQAPEPGAPPAASPTTPQTGLSATNPAR